MDTEHMHIGQLAAEVNLNPKTIRYYEEMGLLAPSARSRAGYRQYTDGERETLRFIIKAKASGLTLAEIGEILALRRQGVEPCGHVRAMLDRKLAVVEAQLRDAASAGHGCDGAVCGNIEHHAPGHRVGAAATA